MFFCMFFVYAMPDLNILARLGRISDFTGHHTGPREAEHPVTPSTDRHQSWCGIVLNSSISEERYES